MDSKEQNDALYNALSGSFELENVHGLSLTDIKANVESVVRELLDRNIEKLMSILYRIDVDQKRTDSILKLMSKDDIASQLADEIINRQLQKIETRYRYKNRSR
jgi:hypothetical protein